MLDVFTLLTLFAALVNPANGVTLRLYQQATPPGGFFDFVPRGYDGILPGTTVIFVCNATNDASFRPTWSVRQIGSTAVGEDFLRFSSSQNLNTTFTNNDRTVTILSFSSIFAMEYECSSTDGSQTTSWATLRAAVAPGPPTIDRSRTIVRDFNATVAWNPPVETGYVAITSYDIRYRLIDGSNSTSIARSTSGTSILIHPLYPNRHRYIFEVRAVNVIGPGPYSNTTIETQLAAPQAPKDFNITVLTVTESTATFNVAYTSANQPCLSPCDEEIVSHNMTETSGLIAPFSVTSGTTITLRNLRAFTTYTFVLYAFNAGPLSSPPSNAQKFQTTAGKPSLPRNVRPIADNITDTTIGVEWDVPLQDGGLKPLVYAVQYRVASESGFNRLPSQSGLRAEITGLQPATSYYIEIRANNTQMVSDAASITLETKRPPGTSGPRPGTSGLGTSAPPNPTSAGSTIFVSPLIFLFVVFMSYF